MSHKKEVLENLKLKNLSLENDRTQNLQKPVKRTKKYLSIYLYSLFGISITGSFLVLVAFFTSWLPSAVTALAVALTAITSTLALPLPITIPIITMALLLAPIAAFYGKNIKLIPN